METTKHTLTLGDRKFEIVAPLVFEQLRIVEPSLAKIMEMRKASEVPEESYYNLIANAILTAVGDPTFTRAELDKTRMTSADLGNAFKTIAFAAGMWREKENGEAASGEAAAETKVNP